MLVQAYDKICRDVFLQHASVQEEIEGHLPSTSIPEVFERLKIPPEHVHIFETVLRRETNFKRKPEKILRFANGDQNCCSSLFFDALCVLSISFSSQDLL